MNLMASLPEMAYDDNDDEDDDMMAGGGGGGGGMHHDGSVTVHRTIPETPLASPQQGVIAQPLVVGGGEGHGRRSGGPGRMIDNSPSKRAPKSLRTAEERQHAGTGCVDVWMCGCVADWPAARYRRQSD